MSSPAHFFISTHRDDVCFSLSGAVRLISGGHLINIYTQSKYTAHPSLATHSPPLSQPTVTSLREREDSEFAQLMNLERHELGLKDADARGLGWKFEGGETETREALTQAEQISEQLLKLLAQLETSYKDEALTLYCPMAIGGHRDHLATLIGVQRLITTPWGQKHRWIFYEDLPYASWPCQRDSGIHKFLQIMNVQAYKKYCLKLDRRGIERKMELVNIYASQHPSPPRFHEFICRDSSVLGPHEGLWQAEMGQQARCLSGPKFEA